MGKEGRECGIIGPTRLSLERICGRLTSQPFVRRSVIGWLCL